MLAVDSGGALLMYRGTGSGKRGRVYARVYFRRAGSEKLRRKTVSRRFRMCAGAPR